MWYNKDYRIVRINEMKAENFLQVVGMGVIIVNFLYPKEKK
jgi:hypothetical protein